MKKIYSILTLMIPLFCVVKMNAQTVDRSIRPSAAPAKEIEIKDAQTFTLPNGLKVFVVEDNRAPIVYYSLQLDIKPALEGEKAGLQDLFAGVIGTATTSKTKQQLNKEIDLIGAKINLHARGGAGSGLKKYESTMLALLSDMILNPHFTQEELDLVREQAKSGLEFMSSDASQICSRLSTALVYGNQYPDGEVHTVETYERITIDDLQKFYNTYFAPNVVRLVVVGAITESEAKANVQKYFGNWKRKDVPQTKYVIPQAPTETKVAMFSKDGAVQSSINLSYPINFTPGTADAEAATVADHILGGGMSSKLFQNLRETHSYTYGIYSNLHSGELTGLFNLSAGNSSAASVKAEATDSAFVQIISEINNMVNKPITQEELNDAKVYLTGSFGRSLQQPATIARFAMQIDKYNLPKDYFKNYLKRIDALTVADVQAAAKKYFKPENAWIIVVGDKEHAEGLKQFAANNTVQFYDIDANPVAAPETKAADISPEQIIDNYVKAMGGASAIEAITDYTMTATMNAMGQNLHLVKKFKTPQYSLFSLGMGDAIVQKMVFDGTNYKVSGMAGAKDLTEGDEFESAKAEAAVCPEMNFFKNGYTLVVKGIEKINNVEAYIVDVKKGASEIVYYFDTSTHLLIRNVSTTDSPQGKMQQVTEISDYRPVNGVLFPFAIVQKVPSMNMEMKMTLTDIKVNTGLSAEDFK